MNVNYQQVLKDAQKNFALWCPDGADAHVLISVADMALGLQVGAISASAESVYMLWSWLEGKGIDIIARMDAAATKTESVAGQISAAFKKGADGIQLFVKIEKLADVVSELLAIRNDLFFRKKLYIALDIGTVGCFDWSEIFYQVKKIDADGVLLYSDKKSKKKSEKNGASISGQIYGMLDSIDSNFDGETCFYFADGAMQGIEETYRLAQKMCSHILKNAKFFVNSETYKG